ncbi:hypothetical protein ABZ897_20665 [Nonomuraea sp. NPDC046802]|uniref:hypothetical protein n=1 Tax=Nonomuraea sp. NPDC046802 TaxID=3154919 RepID=UPI0033F8701F
MLGLGATELVFLLVPIAVLALGVGLWLARRRAAHTYLDLDLLTPIEVQARAHDLIEVGRFDDAVELIRKESRVSPHTAEQVANALLAGHVLPGVPTMEEDDLPTTIRRLVAEGRRKQAVFLARSHEDMSRSEAEAFVDSLTSPEQDM